MKEVGEAITGHYGQSDLISKIVVALQNGGKNIDALTTDDIASFDEFHFGGRAETTALAELAQLGERMQVLDVGSGVGGPARTLAVDFGCRVTGIDLTEDFCRAADMLTNLVGLGDRVTFRQANALDLPFEDGLFDVAWLQHVSMNIEDKSQLFGEIWRVLRPGGRLAFHEVLEGPSSGVRFPVFWASDESMSFLERPKEIRELLSAIGYSELQWADVTTRAAELTKKRRAAATKEGPPPLGLNVIVSKDVSQKVTNSLHNLEQGRIVVIQAVFEKTG